MRMLPLVFAVAALAFAGCKKKNDAPAAGSGSGAASGSAGADAAPAGDQQMANKAGNCPSAVQDARSELLDDKTRADAVVLSITAATAPETETIRKRAAHLVEVQGAPDAQIKHSGEGTGGGEGMCPVVTSKDVKIASEEIEGGVKITMTPSGAVTTALLQKDVADRIAKLGSWKDFKPTDHSGGGGGQGGGQGDHGGNHSGDGDGQGKDGKAPAAPQPAGEPAVPTKGGAGSGS